MLRKIYPALTVLLLSFLVTTSLSTSRADDLKAVAVPSTLTELSEPDSGTPPADYVPTPYFAAKQLAAQGYADVLLIQTSLPWDSTANMDMLNSLQFTYDIADWDDIESGQVDIYSYRVVLIVNDQVQAFYDDYAEHVDEFTAWVQDGHILLFFAASDGWAGGTLNADLPGGVSVVTPHYEYYNYIVDDGHPIVTGQLSDGIPLTDADMWSTYCSHGYFTSLPPDATIIFEEQYGYPTMVEYTLGNGFVIASTNTWEYSYAYWPGYFATKALDDVFLYAICQGRLARGHMQVFLSDFYDSNEEITPAFRVVNPTDVTQTYVVSATLSKVNGLPTYDTLATTLTVNAEATSWAELNFGAKGTGLWNLQAELRVGGQVLQTSRRSTVILNTDQLIVAQSYVGLLSDTADREFNEMTSMATQAFIGDLFDLGLEEATKFITDKFVSLAEPIQQAGGLPPTANNAALAQVEARLQDAATHRWKMAVVARAAASLYGYELPQGFDPLANGPEQLAQLVGKETPQYKALRQVIVNAMADWFDQNVVHPVVIEPERVSIAHRGDTFIAYLMGLGHFVMDDEVDGAFRRGMDSVANVSESDALFTIGPYTLFGRTFRYDLTLYQEQDHHEQVKLVNKIIKWAMAIAAVVGLVILALVIAGVIASGGTLAAVVGPIAWKIASILFKIYKVTRFLPVLIAVAMLFTVVLIAPHVTERVDSTLSEVENLLSLNARAQGLTLENMSVHQVADGQLPFVSLRVSNPSAQRVVQQIVETTIYSVDGRVVDLYWEAVSVSPGQVVRLEHVLQLPAGTYRAVATLHNSLESPLTSLSQLFTLSPPHPAVQLQLALDKTQVAVGETLEASVWVTNPGTDDLDGLTLIIQTDDGGQFQVWSVALPGGTTQRYNVDFVANGEGAHLVRGTLAIGLSEIANQDAGYVVGSAPAVVINYEAADQYVPGSDVSVDLRFANVGNQDAATSLLIRTLDWLHGLSPVYSQTISVTLAASASQDVTSLVLPNAMPGQYRTQLSLDEQIYDSFDFAVAAEDTIFGRIWPDKYICAPGESVTLDIAFTDSTYAYIDVDANAQVLDSNGGVTEIPLTWQAQGCYRGSYTPVLPGTHEIEIGGALEGYRILGDQTVVVVAQASQLIPEVAGEPIVADTKPLTLTVRNEKGVPVADTHVAISATGQMVDDWTANDGTVVFWLSPVVPVSYDVDVEKAGYARTTFELPSQIISDTMAPILLIDAPEATNQSPLAITGATEPGATLRVNEDTISVAADGNFTATVDLALGLNLLLFETEDAASNTSTVPVSVTLDMVAPLLTVTEPTDGENLPGCVIAVKGTTEPATFLTVNGILVSVEEATGAFSYWLVAEDGGNVVTIGASDAAGNATQRTLTVYSVAPRIYSVVPDRVLYPSMGEITINGTNFADTPTVLIGNIPAEQVTFNDSTSLLVRLPVLAPGTYSITVANPDGRFDELFQGLVVSSHTLYLPLTLKSYGTPTPTWSSTTGLSAHAVYALAPDPTNCHTRYAGANDGAYKSTDTGNTWAATGLNGPLVTSVAVDPTAPQTVYAATWGQGVYKSTDGSASWTQINSGLGSNMLVFPLAMAPDGSALYVGTIDGGVYKTTNGGVSWSPVNNGLGNLEIRGLTVDPNNSQVVYAGTTDGAYKSTNSGASWSAADSGLSSRTVWVLAVHPTSSATIFAGTDSGVYRSTNGGASWSRMGLTGETVYALVVDPLDGQRIYAGTDGNGVHRSADGGATWTAMNTGLGNLLIEALGLDAGSCHTLQAGTHDGVWTYFE